MFNFMVLVVVALVMLFLINATVPACQGNARARRNAEGKCLSGAFRAQSSLKKCGVKVPRIMRCGKF